MKKAIVVLVIFLFILSTVGSMAVNNNITYSMKQSTYESYLLEDYYDCYSLDEIPENIRPIISNEEENQDTPETENAIYKIDTPELSNGPMDSPWPVKCHDVHHTGRSPYSTIDTCAEKWRFNTDGWVEETPVIDSDGIIYFGGNHGGLPYYLHAVYPDGTLKWRYKTGDLIRGSSPAIAEDGTVYIGSWDGQLYAINSNDTLKWKFNTGAIIPTSPVIADDGTIYLGTEGDKIYAVNPNGTKKWHYSTGDWITSDPAIGNDSTVYIGSMDYYLYALYPNGTLRWRCYIGNRIYGSPSIADDGTIYIGSSWSGYLYAVYPNGTLKWKYKNAGTPSNPSIGSDGTIYSTYLYYLVALNPNGTLKWNFYIGDDRFIGKSAPAISSDEIIYFGIHLGVPGNSNGREIIAVNPDGTERWREKIANKWVESSPSIAEDGTVYIGSAHTIESGYLHAFGVGELTADANGPYYGLTNQPLQFTGSSSGGYLPHSYHWDFGDTQTSEEQNPIHTYTNPGNYTIILTVIDNKSNTVTDTTYAWIQNTNTAPDKPTINGPTHGAAGTAYDYKFIATDSDNSIIYLYVDWGDTSNTGWCGPYNNGQQVTLSHSWSEQDTYTIKAKAKDPYDAEGPWGTLDVTMPKNKILYNPLLLRLLERFPILEKMLLYLIE